MRYGILPVPPYSRESIVLILLRLCRRVCDDGLCDVDLLLLDEEKKRATVPPHGQHVIAGSKFRPAHLCDDPRCAWRGRWEERIIGDELWHPSPRGGERCVLSDVLYGLEDDQP